MDDRKGDEEKQKGSTSKPSFKCDFCDLGEKICDSCRFKVCNQSHLLDCKALIGSNQLVTYIPNYEDIFDDENLAEQFFIANILITNLKRKKKIESVKK